MLFSTILYTRDCISYSSPPISVLQVFTTMVIPVGAGHNMDLTARLQTEQSCLHISNPVMAVQIITGHLRTCFLRIRYCSFQGHVYCLVLSFESRDVSFLLVKISEIISSSAAPSRSAKDDAWKAFTMKASTSHLSFFTSRYLLQHLTECLGVPLIKYRKPFLFCLVSPICAYLKYSGMSKLSHILINFEILCKKVMISSKSLQKAYFSPKCAEKCILDFLDVYSPKSRASAGGLQSSSLLLFCLKIFHEISLQDIL